MRKSFISFCCAVLLGAGRPETLHATGGFSPDRWLDNGGIASDMSPEFYWELELKRMAREYTPPEKRVLAPAPKTAPDQEAPAAGSPVVNFTAQIDAADFDDAIKTGRVKPSDPEKAKSAHQAAREMAGAAPERAADLLAKELPSEFADYHRGACAFWRGAGSYDEARAAWEALLKRPEGERHYRSVWAAFMLGKLALATNDPSAVKWFRQTRELAKAGFADSAGLAADSYGWEAKSELFQQHFEAAARLYLTQLALGDESAIVSLKAVIPDRPSVGGTTIFSGAPPEMKKWDETQEALAQKHLDEAQADLMQKRLDECAWSPVLRRLVTAHVLATESAGALWSYGGGYGSGPPDESQPKAESRCLRWLAALEKAGSKGIDDADHIGWVAYTAGRYKEAARWLAMANPQTPTALWLKAKLERRDGKLPEATATMAAAFKLVRADVIEFGETTYTYGERGYGPEQSAAGDLAGLHLSRGEFVNAMDVFLQGQLWEDAAFVGDRVLTVSELKKYVDAHYPESTSETNDKENVRTIGAVPFGERDVPSGYATRMRWMLARRLVRDNRFEDARPYFMEKERAALGRYAAAWKAAANTKAPKPQRAKALFTAAWIARHDGMEIMGTEVEPDGFINEGEFPPGNADTERVEGVRLRRTYDQKEGRNVTKKTTAKLSIPATAAEKQRIIGNAPRPQKRYHYRWVAAELAWRAAGMMSDGSEELADVLNTGGSWIKNVDETGADKFIQAIERRCPRTRIGEAELSKHWFVDQSGPWSGALEKEEVGHADDAKTQ